MRRYVPILLAWLFLALPLAQVAALSHQLTHRDQAPAGTQHETKKGTHSGDCAQCLSYSAFAAGGVASTPLAIVPELRGTLPAERTVIDGRARLNFPYSSQAPPVLLV